MLRITIFIAVIIVSPLVYSAHHHTGLALENVPGSLHHAAKTNDTRHAHYLLQLGASKRKIDPATGRTPLETAHHYHSQDCIGLLTQSGNPLLAQHPERLARTLVFAQATNKATVCAFVHACLEQKQDPRALVSPVWSLLHFATHHRLARPIL